MSIVPYRPAERHRKRRPLDQARIVRTALELLDEVGLDEVTMRRLAERLGVKAAALYRHISHKDELLVLLGDFISAEIPQVKTTKPWREQLRDMAHNVRRGLLVHRDAARLLAITPPFGPHRLRHVESLLRTMRSAGLSRRDAARAAYHCNTFVTEFVADQARFTNFAAAPGSTRRKTLLQARQQFKSLSRVEYPTIVDLADELSTDDPDGLFELGLNIWLLGLDALVRRKRRRSSTAR